MRRLITSLVAATLVAGLTVGSAFAGNGPPHVGFYIDGATYLTVGTPTDSSAPAHRRPPSTRSTTSAATVC